MSVQCLMNNCRNSAPAGEAFCAKHRGYDNEPLESQIERLAAFIMDNIPGEPRQNEGAVDCAIRIMSQPSPAASDKSIRAAELRGRKQGLEAAAKVADYQATISGCQERRTARLGLRRKAYFTEIGREVKAAIRAINPETLGEGE